MLTYTRNGKTYEFDPAQLTDKARDYLLQYGWAQSLQDSIAGREKKVREELADKIANGVEQLADDEIEAQVKMDIDAALSKRMDAIINSTITERGVGEQRDPLRAVANDMVRKAAAAKGSKVTKDKLKELVDQILADETKRAKVQAELDRRKEETIEIDV